MELNYKIVKELGVLSERKGFQKKLCLVSWNNRPAKYDIREWSTEEEGKMNKGITISKEEMDNLKNIIKDLETE